MGKKRHVVYSKSKKTTKKKKKKKLDNEDLYFAQQEKQHEEQQRRVKREHKQVRQLEAMKEEEAPIVVKTTYGRLLENLGAVVDDEVDDECDGKDEELDEFDVEEQDTDPPPTVAQEIPADPGTTHNELFGDGSESEEEAGEGELRDDHFSSYFHPIDGRDWGKESLNTWPRAEAVGPTPLEAPRQSLYEYCDDNLAAKAKILPKTERTVPLFHYFTSYRDVHLADHNYENNELVRDMYTLHVTNHVLKARAKVMKYNSLMQKETAADVSGQEGFCRLKCLIVVPYRSACFDVVNRILRVCPSKQVMNKARFEKEFGPEDETPGEVVDDHSHLMAGNNDDKFRIGLSFARSCVKLYTPFYRSDILVCSPLGLRLIVGSKDDKKREFDFLSSLDILVLDRCDVLRMQNWDHLRECIQVLNVQPDKLPENCDIRRLRQAFINQQGRLFRQTIATSRGHFPDVHGVFVDRFQPPRARARTTDDDDEEDMQDIVEPVGPRKNFRGLVQLGTKSDGTPLKQGVAYGIQRQLFLMLECPSPSDVADARFEGFQQKFWPTASGLNHLLIVLSGNLGYADLLRLRSFFDDEGVDYCVCHEYSSNKALSKSRKEFFDGTNRVMLITERWWWFRRYRIKGAEQILFYGIPETENLYSEALSWIKTPSRCNSMTLAMLKWDIFSLERLAGHNQVKQMMRAKANKIFSFASSPS